MHALKTGINVKKELMKLQEIKKLIKQTLDIAVYEDIAFWPRTCSGQLLVDLVILGPKKFQNKDEPFALNVRPGIIVRG